MVKRSKRLLALLGVACLTLSSVAPASVVKAEENSSVAVEAQAATKKANKTTITKAEAKELVKYSSDFSNWKVVPGPGGDAAGTGSIKTENGEMTISGFNAMAIDENSPEIADGTITARVKANQLNSLMLVFRYQDKDNFASLGFGSNNVMYVSRVGGGESYNIKSFSYDYSNKEYIDIKCTFKGNSTQIFIDGKYAASFDLGCTAAGKMGIRHWGSPVDVTFASMSCTNEIVETADLLKVIEEARQYDKGAYTPESVAVFEEAFAAAEKVAADPQSQAEVDAAAEALRAAIKNLEEKEDRITADEDYTDGANDSKWSADYEAKDGALAFDVAAGEAVVNENEEMQNVDAGLYTYKVKTDSQGRFGVSFNGNALYSDEAGTYKVKALDGKEKVFADKNLELEADTWYEIKVLRSMDTLKLYVNDALVAGKEVSGLASEKGGIGLYNPTTDKAQMEIGSCEVYELLIYFNDFSDASKLGEWELSNAEVSFVENGELDGSGEVSVNLKGVSRAIAKDTPKIADGIYEFDLIEKADPNRGESGRLGFMFRATGMDRFEQVYHDVGATWGIRTKVPGSAGEWAQEAKFTNGIKFADNQKYHIRMETEGESVKMWIDDEYMGAINLSRKPVKGHFGFLKWYLPADVRLDNLKIQETMSIVPEVPAADPIVMENGTMKVTLNKNFPQIMQYEMNGKTLLGNPKAQNTLMINGEAYYPVVSCNDKDGKLVYKLTVPSIGVSLDVTYALDKNNVKMDITNVKETGDVKVETIQFKDDVFATTNADMATASMGMDTVEFNVTEKIWETMDKAQVGSTNHTYGMLASGGLAITANNTVIDNGRRFVGNVYEENGAKIGQIGNGVFEYTLPAAPENKKTYEPSVTITLCEDYNADGEVNYQDAAANYKNIRSEVFGIDQMKDNVMWIAYNSVSQVQEPFMRSLDLGKEVYNFTDGFGQMIMQKGYEAQGHDTMHGLYAYNTGEHQGGKKDFTKVMELGKKYNIKYGIHLNVNEHHVESMNYDTVRHPLSPGWGLWSQAYWVDQKQDIVSGNRDKRLRMLKEDLPDLNFVYYDIYGNNGDPQWMGQSLGEVTEETGLILGTEFGGPLEQYKAFTHWGQDLDYPNTGNESKLMRYFKNDADIYIGNALLKGNKMLNIGTWEGTNTDMVRGVQTFYNHTLPSKYLMHFDLMDYENDYAKFTDGVMTERKGDTVEMTKDGKLMATWKWWNNAESGKENQEITGDATLLLPWYGKDSKTKNPSEADKLYYWNPEGGETTWDVSMHDGWTDGTRATVYRLTTDEKEEVGEVRVKDGKITLDLESGYGYVLYRKGSKPEKAVTNFGEGTPLKDPNFINDKGNAWKLKGDVSYKKDEAVITTKASKAGYDEYIDDEGYDPYLSFEGKGEAFQTMTGLKPGKTYTVYGFADVAEGDELEMSVKVGGKTHTNTYGYSELKYRGIPRYANTHTQKVKVTFDVPEGEESAKLTFKANGTVRLQDLRVWENLNRTPQITDKGMEDYILYEDFENAEQGYGPFIVDSRLGTWDVPVQVAEYRESRPEYDNKETGEKWKQFSDYVANGRYSLKTDVGGNGFDNGGTANGPVYRSIPGTVNFEPNTKYEINFKYVTGVSDRHDIEVRDKAGHVVYKYNFQGTERVGHSFATAEETATFITGNSDDYYVVVNLIDNKAGIAGGTDENGSIMERCFLSLDDISIKRVAEDEEITSDSLKDLIQKAETDYASEDYNVKAWGEFQKAIAKAKVALDKDGSTQADVEEAYYQLRGAIIDLETSKDMVVIDDSRDLALDGMTATAGSEETVNDRNQASQVLDNDPSTIWHTKWGVNAGENRWIDIALKEAATVGGVRVLSRADGGNGTIHKADIYVKTAGSDGYVKAAENARLGSGWQTVTFDEIENVTNVKIQAIDSVNGYASAAEIRIMGAKSESAFVKPDKTDLQAAVDVVKRLNAKDYTAETWAVLEEKLAQAEEILAKEDAAYYDVYLAEENLCTAVENLVVRKHNNKK